VQGWLSPHRISPKTREALLSLLDSRETQAAMESLQDLGLSEDFPVHATLISLLSHLEMGEAEAAEHWCAIALRREELTWRLGRDPGTRVAAMDYFLNEQKLLSRPTVVDESALDRAAGTAEADGLTGLASGRTYFSSVKKEIRRAGRRIQEFCIALLDLDDFGRVNRERGRGAGDGVLRDVSGLIRARLRDMDLAGRLGGGHFGLLLPLTRRTGAQVAVERIRVAVKEAFLRGGAYGPPIAVTISAGIAMFPDDGEDAIDLLEKGAQALALAMERGGNQVILHPSERRNSLRVRPLGMPIKMWVGGSGLASLEPLRIRDISGSGALLEGPLPLEEGEEVLLRLPGELPGEGILLEARVVRRGLLPSEAGGTLRTAVQLRVKPPVDPAGLELFLEELRRRGVE
jgi:diguanylate cyclase (GGDEF)-like protein